jgi:RNA polymerase sigma-70 factor (ECF subfamily)
MLIHSGIQAGIQVGIEAGIQAGIQAGVDAGTRTVKAAARRIAHASSIGFSAILPVRPTAPRPTEKRATQKSSTFSNASRPAVSPSNYANSDTHTTGRIAREARSDEQLVVAHRAGDSSALRALIERYQGELHGFLTRLVGSRAGADDVFQEAFLQVHLSADSFDEERRFKPWLYTIAANKGRDFLRRQKRRQAMSLDAPVGASGEAALVDLLDGPDQAPASSLESSDEASIVKGVVDELPSHFREILLLAYFQKMSYAQISDSLSIPLGTVKSRLHAAVASFAESWRLACARRGLPSNATPLPAKLRGKDDDSTR